MMIENFGTRRSRRWLAGAAVAGALVVIPAAAFTAPAGAAPVPVVQADGHGGHWNDNGNRDRNWNNNWNNNWNQNWNNNWNQNWNNNWNQNWNNNWNQNQNNNQNWNWNWNQGGGLPFGSFGS